MPGTNTVRIRNDADTLGVPGAAGVCSGVIWKNDRGSVDENY